MSDPHFRHELSQRHPHRVGDGTPAQLDKVGRHRITNTVAATTVRDLLTGVADIAASVAADGLGRTERLARASRAAEHLRNVGPALAALNPYATGGRCLLSDLLGLAGQPHWQAVAGDLDDAAERVSLDAMHRGATRQVRALHVDLSMARDVIGPPATVSPTPLADELATPTTEPLGRPTIVATPWTALPAAAIDTDPIPDVSPVIGAQTVPLTWTTSRWGFSDSAEFADWTVGAAEEVERLTKLVVNVGLERELFLALTIDAPTAADYLAAEVAVGTVWPAGADIILAHAADVPRIRRTYAAANLAAEDRPWIVATAGAAAGTALFMATGAVTIETSTLDWMIADRPRDLGRDIVAYRYGRARCRVAGAVQLAPVI